MEPQEPKPPDNREPASADDALRRLEERLGRASEAAERLIAEASGSVRAAATRRRAQSPSAGEDPRSAGARAAMSDCERGQGDAGSAPAGGDPESALTEDSAGSRPAGGDPDAIPLPPPAGWQIPSSEEERHRDGDLELLIHVIHALRDLVPPDLQRRLAEALRELLLAIRALIDWYLERGEQRRSAGGEVQDIPIT